MTPRHQILDELILHSSYLQGTIPFDSLLSIYGRMLNEFKNLGLIE